jgi:type II secretion system protein N
VNRTRLISIAAAVLAAFLFLPWLTLCFIPDNALLAAVNSQLTPQGLQLSAADLGRPFPLGISGKGVVLSDLDDNVWLRLDKASIRLRVSSLLIGRCHLGISAGILDGSIRGQMNVWPMVKGNIRADQIALSEIGILDSLLAGARLAGQANLDLVIASPKGGEPEGTAKVQIRPLTLSNLTFGAFKLPDLSSQELRAMLKIKGQSVTVDNLALQTDDIYLRVNGTVPLSANRPLSIQMALMPSSKLLEKQPSLGLLMLPYQQSPGNFLISIGGTTANPQLMPAR